jgi:hypothetical protein
VQVKVQVQNPDKYPTIQLRPEMNATVKFLADEAPKAKTAQEPAGVYVPSTAIRDRDGKKIVLIAYNGKAVAREDPRNEPAQRWSAGRWAGRRRKPDHYRAPDFERRRQNQNQRAVLNNSSRKKLQS